RGVAYVRGLPRLGACSWQRIRRRTSSSEALRSARARVAARTFRRGRQTLIQKFVQVSPHEQEPRYAGALRRRDIALLVADENAAVLVDVKIRKRSQDHPRAGLAVNMGTAESLDACLGMVGGVIKGVDKGTMYCQSIAHPGVQRVDGVLAVVPMGHASLVRHHDHAITEII